MGLFDIFKKKSADAGPAENKTPAASPEELKNQSRKSNFYKFAFVFFPKGLFEKTETTIMAFAKGQQQALNDFLAMYNEMGGKLEPEDLTRCKLSYFDGFKGNKSVLVFSFPDVDAPTGNLHPVFGPYYAAVIYSPSNLNEVEYMILCQSFDGKTSFRELNAKGMNINCGAGPAGNAGEEEFLKALEKLG